MSAHPKRNPLFPPTPRQNLILLLTALSLGLAAAASVPGTFLLMISPWIMGMMIMIFDRQGPGRNWLGPVVHSLFYPIALVVYDSVVLERWMRTGSLSTPFIAATVNILLVGCWVFFCHYLWPRRCPTCNRRGLVPLMPLVWQEKRSNSTHWCAACGSQFWKNARTWEPERRRTWWNPGAPGSRTPHEATAGRSREEAFEKSA